LEDSVVVAISKGAKVPQGIWLCGIDPVWDHWDGQKGFGFKPHWCAGESLACQPSAIVSLAWVGYLPLIRLGWLVLCFPK